MRPALRPALASLMVALTAAASAAVPDPLPPPECVRLMRSARIAERAGEPERALELLGQAMQRFPREVLPVQQLLQLQEALGSNPEYASALRGRLLERLEDPTAPLGTGSLHFLVERLPDDPEVLRRVLAGIEGRGTSHDVELLRAKAVVQSRLGLMDEARQTLASLIEVKPTYEALAIALRIDLDREEWYAALRLIGPHLENRQFGAAFRTVHLDLLARTGQTDLVRAELAALREEESGAALAGEGYRSLVKVVAWSLYDAGELELTEWLWRRLLAENPEDREARLVVANLFATEEERRAQTALADEQLESEVEPEALLEAGTEYLAAGDARRAYELLSRAAAGLPDSEAAWFNLGLAAERLEDWDQARRAYERAVGINPQRADTQASLGMALVRLDRCPAAIPRLRAAVALDSSRVADLYYLAGCYRQTGDAAAAAAATAEYERRRKGG